jgi:hypothetical protein
MPGETHHLAGFISKPFIQDACLAAMRASPTPMLLREVIAATGETAQGCRLALERLEKKGFVTKFKIPIRSHGAGREGRPIVPNATLRMLNLYSLVEGNE